MGGRGPEALLRSGAWRKVVRARREGLTATSGLSVGARSDVHILACVNITMSVVHRGRAEGLTPLWETRGVGSVYSAACTAVCRAFPSCRRFLSAQTTHADGRMSALVVVCARCTTRCRYAAQHGFRLHLASAAQVHRRAAVQRAAPRFSLYTTCEFVSCRTRPISSPW